MPKQDGAGAFILEPQLNKSKRRETWRMSHPLLAIAYVLCAGRAASPSSRELIASVLRSPGRRPPGTSMPCWARLGFGSPEGPLKKSRGATSQPWRASDTSHFAPSRKVKPQKECLLLKSINRKVQTL